MTNRTESRIKASPRARRAIAQLGVDAAAVRGSGPEGRIVESDVLRAAAAGGQRPATSAARRAIAAATTHSFSTVPHFYLRAEVDATAMITVRERILAGASSDARRPRVTITDFLLCAMAQALRDCPFANCVWKDGLVQLPGIDIGLVVAAGDGLLVPRIRQAGGADLLAMARKRSHLVDAARAGKAPADCLSGGAASLSNLGASRVDEFAAIILPGQSSMLAVGRIAPRPFVVEGQLCVRPTVRLCLSADHRVMDGLSGAKFLGRIVELLET
ncbi:MAG: 2-oxo acid dehydrogenase subunit E2 [Phycisphaerae bacterium]|nr:2-oxo acid dehydrogenase subunit E2 [Phycisphaerae bacterium]